MATTRDTKRISASIKYYRYLESPVGSLMLAGTEKVLMLINFPAGSQARKPRCEWTMKKNIFPDAVQQLQEYFDGIRKTFSMEIELDGTGFQKQTWQALRKIPYGVTVSYGELAKSMKRPNASRAVGAANHANPLPIVVPCHRVIGADNSLTGFGGGIDTKRWLLEFEARNCGHDGAQLKLL